MEKFRKHLFLLVFIGFSNFLSVYFLGCNKTDHPLGVNAPQGLDQPTFTATPQPGDVHCYVFDQSNFVQGVTINLISPSGLTIGTTITQSGVGYAQFNVADLVDGSWQLEVPAQSISYIYNPGGGPVTVRKSYDVSYLTLPVNGGGSYSVSFTSGASGVSVAPVLQHYTTAPAEYFPVTYYYLEQGNLNVPINLQVVGVPTTFGLGVLNPLVTVMGTHNGILSYPVTLQKLSCNFSTLPVTLSFQALDNAGNSIGSIGLGQSLINRGYSVPVTVLADKHSNGGGTERNNVMINWSNDCGTDVWNLKIISSASLTPLFNGTVTNGYVFNFTTGTTNDNVSITISSAIGTFTTSYYRGTIAFDSYSVIGTTTF